MSKEVHIAEWNCYESVGEDMDDPIGQRNVFEVVNHKVVDQSNKEPVDEDGDQKIEEVVRAGCSNVFHCVQGRSNKKGES